MTSKHLILILLSILSFIKNPYTEGCIEKIPLEDRKELEGLFYYLVQNEHFGYTLFGDKPVSFGSYFKLTPWENVIELGQRDGSVWKKWQIWEKYAHLFPTKHYLLIKEKSVNKNYEFVSIILINKNTFIKTLKEHQALFKKILKRKINPEEILTNLESGKTSLTDSIDNHDLLLGILLGYGKHNATLYHKRNNAHPSCFQLKNSDINLEPFGDYHYSPLFLESVHFVADFKHPETQTLEQKYRDLRGKISAIYAQGDFLTITLSQLISEQ